jgi:protein NRD1
VRRQLKVSQPTTTPETKKKEKAHALSKCYGLCVGFQILNANCNIDIESTTPEGSPAPGLNALAGLQGQPQTANAAGASSVPDTSIILKALADMAKQNPTAPAATSAPAPGNPLSLLTPASSSVDQAAQSATGPNVNPYGNPFAALGNLAAPNPMMPAPNTLPGGQPNPLAAVLPQAAAGPQPGAASLTPDVFQQVQLLQLLAAQGIPQDQWATALQILSLSNNANPAAGGLPNLNAIQGAFNLPDMSGQQGWPGHGDRDADRDRGRDRDYMRSPPGQYRRRSGSPGWERRREGSPPRRRDSPVYGEYAGDSPGRRGGRRGNDYRQRSPPGRRRRTPSPPRKDSSLPPPGPKLVEWDYSIGQGNIKVLSRTLFVGGVTYVSSSSFLFLSLRNKYADSYYSSSEAQLRALFNRFGLVQTCIVNVDKRHAFIKMINRLDAMNARDGMETYKSGEMQLRVSLLFARVFFILFYSQTRCDSNIL